MRRMPINYIFSTNKILVQPKQYAFQFDKFHAIPTGSIYTILVCSKEKFKIPKYTITYCQLFFLCLLGLPLPVLTYIFNAVRLFYRDKNV